jgi:hypothetical protein
MAAQPFSGKIRRRDLVGKAEIATLFPSDGFC